jgi:hypothetical protein
VKNFFWNHRGKMGRRRELESGGKEVMRDLRRCKRTGKELLFIILQSRKD